MEDRDEERRLLSQRINELEKLDSTLKGTISKEKTQYNVLCIWISFIAIE